MRNSQKGFATGLIVSVIAIVVIVIGAFIYLRGKSTHPLNTVGVVNNQATTTWNGQWVLGGSNNFGGGKLNIVSINNSSFQFTLDDSNGGNVGSISSTDESGTKPIAHIKNNTALSVIKVDANTECDVNFTLISPTEVSVRTNSCGVYAGEGVGFDGTYIKDGTVKQLSLNDIVVSDGSGKPIFENQNQIDAFKKLTGDEYATLFANSFMAVFTDKNLDNFEAKAYDGFLQGSASSAGIIMMDSSNKIWAAVNDYDATSSQYLVRYFTNDPVYQNQLPRTIQAWISQSAFDKNAKVIFTYKAN